MLSSNDFWYSDTSSSLAPKKLMARGSVGKFEVGMVYVLSRT